MGPIRNPNWNTSGMRVTLSYLAYYKCLKSDLLITSALNPFSELLPNLYYSPIKKLENIFIFKIVRQKRP